MTYIDTSALATLYFAEPRSAAVAEAILTRPKLAVSDLTAAELASVAGIKLRTGQTSPEAAREALGRFAERCRARSYRRLKIRAKHFRYARDRIARFDAPLRTLDALHLATAALAGAELMTLDRALAKSAEAAGVAVVAPA